VPCLRTRWPQSGIIDMMRADRMEDGEVVLSLSHPEALILFDLLHHWEGDLADQRLPFVDQAEQRVLWDLTAVLEFVIDEAFSDGYVSLVAAARDQVRDPSD
jgi:hypothetical protein